MSHLPRSGLLALAEASGGALFCGVAGISGWLIALRPTGDYVGDAIGVFYHWALFAALLRGTEWVLSRSELRSTSGRLGLACLALLLTCLSCALARQWFVALSSVSGGLQGMALWVFLSVEDLLADPLRFLDLWLMPGVPFVVLLVARRNWPHDLRRQACLALCAGCVALHFAGFLLSFWSILQFGIGPAAAPIGFELGRRLYWVQMRSL